MTPEQLYQWTRDYYRKHGTDPTVRQAAKHFRVTQDEVLDAVNDYHGNNSKYFGVAVGVQIQGVGYYEERCTGKYTIEAY